MLLGKHIGNTVYTIIQGKAWYADHIPYINIIDRLHTAPILYLNFYIFPVVMRDTGYRGTK